MASCLRGLLPSTWNTKSNKAKRISCLERSPWTTLPKWIPINQAKLIKQVSSRFASIVVVENDLSPHNFALLRLVLLCLHVAILEFLSFMLVTLQKVSQADLDEISNLFHKLDKTGDGLLSVDDLKIRSHQVNASLVLDST